MWWIKRLAAVWYSPVFADTRWYSRARKCNVTMAFINRLLYILNNARDKSCRGQTVLEETSKRSWSYSFNFVSLHCILFCTYFCNNMKRKLFISIQNPWRVWENPCAPKSATASVQTKSQRSRRRARQVYVVTEISKFPEHVHLSQESGSCVHPLRHLSQTSVTSSICARARARTMYRRNISAWRTWNISAIIIEPL